MDGTTLVETLTDDLETELSRLGSSKWLYALTDGEMTGSAVRTAAAADAAAAAECFEAWAADADGGTPDVFTALADTATDRAETADADPTDRRTYETLGDFEDSVARLGGALGHSLVLDRTVGQMVGFFVGDADPSTAGTFRDLRDDADADRDRIVAALDDRCDSEDDWDHAADAATAVVEATYDDYVETLESMGVKPKNVC
ncbi:transcription antitermination protein [Haloplanus ruber]|uniref:Transcription antitermination protein n=1 Tax=Haloplanus ruber TaxID=869892 RepID=A0ABD6CVS2_9EURY|nr:transcription antitermination protein [Haloplanus ruber]